YDTAQLFFFLSAILALVFFYFFFTDPATTELYTLSLHDALPIYGGSRQCCLVPPDSPARGPIAARHVGRNTLTGSPYCGSLNSLDRKSTRLNSSHVKISYAVFCLKKKKKHKERNKLIHTRNHHIK